MCTLQPINHVYVVLMRDMQNLQLYQGLPPSAVVPCAHCRHAALYPVQRQLSLVSRLSSVASLSTTPGVLPTPLSALDERDGVAASAPVRPQREGAAAAARPAARGVPAHPAVAQRLQPGRRDGGIPPPRCSPPRHLCQPEQRTGRGGSRGSGRAALAAAVRAARPALGTAGRPAGMARRSATAGGGSGRQLGAAGARWPYRSGPAGEDVGFWACVGCVVRRSRSSTAAAGVPPALRIDAAPHAPILQTELGWLLDDAVAAVAPQPGADWRPATWQQVERDLRTKGPLAGAGSQQVVVQLRETLEALGEWCRETVAEGASTGSQCRCSPTCLPVSVQTSGLACAQASRCPAGIRPFHPPIAEALWERRLRERVPLQYLTACAFWRDVVLSGGWCVHVCWQLVSEQQRLAVLPTLPRSL